MRTRLKIVGATATAVFSLATVFTATYAWFAANTGVSATGMQISVKVSGSATMTSLNLIKFDYDSETIGTMTVYDYLNPATGSVNSYYFNKDYNDGEGSFGYDSNGNFVPINSTMNVYDPVDRVIRGGDLSSLNCNVIYEASFSSNMSSAYLQLFADLLTNKTPTGNQILLSDCVDFDVFYESDIDFSDDAYSSSSTYEIGSFTTYNRSVYKCKTAVESAEEFDSEKWDVVPLYSSSSTYSVGDCVIYSGVIYSCTTSIGTAESFIKSRWRAVETYSSSSTYPVDAFVIHNGHPYICTTAVSSAETFNASKWGAILCEKIYYPSYKTSSLSSSEETYYKISYLSSLEQSHINFYSANSKPEKIIIDRNRVLEFNNQSDEQKVYINVNYAPSQADVYIREIYNTIKAIYDFTFDFQFTTSPEVDA